MSTICTTLMIRLDNWDVDELDNDIGNEDDLMQPVSEPASVPVSEPASEAVIAALNRTSNAINDKLAAFQASLRIDFTERVRTAEIGEVLYWCQDCVTITRNP